MNAELRVFPTLAQLSSVLAADIADLIAERLTHSAVFTVALSGGETPRALGRALAGERREQIDWERVHFYWGDERYVPPEDPRSNFRMAREALLARVPTPPWNIHPMRTNLPDPEEAARLYEAELRRHFAPPWPAFDLALLVLGREGHTASLFPGSPGLFEQTRWVLAVRAPVDPPVRLTLTLPVFNHARRVCFLVAGEEKAEALGRVLSGAGTVEQLPAAGVRPLQGPPEFWADSAAAARVARRPRNP